MLKTMLIILLCLVVGFALAWLVYKLCEALVAPDQPQTWPTSDDVFQATDREIINWICTLPEAETELQLDTLSLIIDRYAAINQQTIDETLKLHC